MLHWKTVAFFWPCEPEINTRAVNVQNALVTNARPYAFQIEHADLLLRNAGAIDIDFYELNLRQNASNRAQVINHLSEAKVALMFLENGAKVTMQDRPDLKIEWMGVVFYAEVKHFNRKSRTSLTR
jgi:hypothetical protein